MSEHGALMHNIGKMQQSHTPRYCACSTALLPRASYLRPYLLTACAAPVEEAMALNPLPRDSGTSQVVVDDESGALRVQTVDERTVVGTETEHDKFIICPVTGVRSTAHTTLTLHMHNASARSDPLLITLRCSCAFVWQARHMARHVRSGTMAMHAMPIGAVARLMPTQADHHPESAVRGSLSPWSPDGAAPAAAAAVERHSGSQRPTSRKLREGGAFVELRLRLTA